MVGTDGSENAQAAVRWAAALAKVEGAQLLVAHSYASPGEDDSAGTEARKAAGDTELAAWLADAGLGDDQITSITTEGDARHTLGPTASDWNADLVVIGTRGRGGYSSLGLGSVAHHLAHHIDTDLVIVPPGSELRPGAPLLVGVDGSHGSKAALRWAWTPPRRCPPPSPRPWPMTPKPIPTPTPTSTTGSTATSARPSGW